MYVGVYIYKWGSGLFFFFLSSSWNLLDFNKLPSVTFEDLLYLYENSFHLHYKAELVNAVWKNNYCIFWESEQTDALGGQNAWFLNTRESQMKTLKVR